LGIDERLPLRSREMPSQASPQVAQVTDAQNSGAAPKIPFRPAHGSTRSQIERQAAQLNRAQSRARPAPAPG